MLPILALAAFVCTPMTVRDGDSLMCAGREVRLAAIDAADHPRSPKCRQRKRGAWCDVAAYESGKVALRELVARGPVSCTVVDAAPGVAGFQAEDIYHRPVARCSSGGVDLSDAMLKGGWAHRWP